MRGAVGARPVQATPKAAQHRTRQASETFERVAPFAAAAGITRIADVTGLDHVGIFTAMVTRPNSRSLSVFQGKGLDLVSAKVSGLMEAVETYHAERLDWPVRLLSWDEIAGGARCADPWALPRPPTSRFDGRRRIPWIEALSLSGTSPVLVPLELVHTAFARPLPEGSGSFTMSSNGLASGNTYCEAACHALCEVIERDSFARFQKEGVRGQNVEIGAIGGQLGELASRLEAAGCSVSITDITSPIGVPAFYATVRGGSDAPATARPAGGLGCHPDAAWACTRAVLEAAQSRLTRIVGARDDLTRSDYADRPVPDAAIADDAEKTPRGIGQGIVNDTVEDDLRWICERLAGAGLDEILLVDLSRREFGIPVLRAVVPGLRHPAA